MDEGEKFAKMDMLRVRFQVTYAQAREALEATNWDAVEAALKLEAGAGPAPTGFVEELKVTGSDLVETIKRLLHEGNINRIIVKDPRGIELLNLPVNGLIAVTVFVPFLTALGAVVVLAMDYTVLVERKA